MDQRKDTAVLDAKVPALPVLLWVWLCLLNALTTYIHTGLEATYLFNRGLGSFCGIQMPLHKVLL